MSRVYHLSDAHRGHELVAKIRGFATVEEHDAALDDAVRSTLTKRDTMWWLGDMTGGGRIQWMLDWVASLPGTHHLVAGNHDPVHPMHHGHGKQRAYLRAFASVQTIAHRTVGDYNTYLSHFPVVGDHKERRYLEKWRPRPIPGGVLLHGHTHSTGKVSMAKEPGVAPMLQVHVGIDAWGMTPVSDAQILDLIDGLGR